MNTAVKKQIDQLYEEEVTRWSAAWDEFYRQWDRLRGHEVEITDEELDSFEEREAEILEAEAALVGAWDREAGWPVCLEAQERWHVFSEAFDVFLERQLVASDRGEPDLGLWPSDVPAAPLEDEAEERLWRIALREMASAPEHDVVRLVAHGVLFMLTTARLARHYARPA